MLLENSSFDSRFNTLQAYPVYGYIIDGQLDHDQLKSALQHVIEHFPVLGARMCGNGKELMIPEEQGELFSWTFEDCKQPMAEVFAAPRQTDVISVTAQDTDARADFYIPLKSTTVRLPSVADERSPLIEVRVRRFIDKTVIGVSANHLLTDGGGMAILLSSWTKALRGESLPEVASNNDPFKAHLRSDPTLPSGTVIPRFSKKVQLVCGMITEILRYGPPKSRSIFIPNEVLHKWKSMSDGVSTNDLITAWVLKAWASTDNSSRTVSVYTNRDLRKHLPEVVPPTYLRNAASVRPSHQTLKVKDINKMSQLEVAKIIRSFVNYYTPDQELNFQSYRFVHKLNLLPQGNSIFTISSWSYFNFPQMDFGAKTESFEGFIRMNRNWGNIGNVWLENEGARITLWMSKRRWNKGIWRTINEQ